MKFFALITLLFMVCFSITAQTTNSTKSKFIFGADIGLPTGSTAHKYNVMFGGFIQQSIPVTRSLHVTLNIAYNKLKGESNVEQSLSAKVIYTYPDIDIIAANAGLKYYLGPAIYFKAEGGAAILESTIAFVYAPQIGIDIPIGKTHLLDVALRYEGSNNYGGPNLNKVSFAGLRVGFGF